MNAFIDLVQSLFPTSIPPFTADKAKESLKQFKKDNKFGQNSLGLGKEYDFFETKKVDFLRQGDIIDNLTFYYFNTKGEQKRITCKGMLLSNTCDASRDDYIHVAPLIPISSLIEGLDIEKRENYINDLKNNRIFRFLYLPHSSLKDYVVNFHLITSFPRKWVMEKIKKNEKNIELSLNTIGFYLLLCKLTVYFMREEKAEETFRDKAEQLAI